MKIMALYIRYIGCRFSWNTDRLLQKRHNSISINKNIAMNPDTKEKTTRSINGLGGLFFGVRVINGLGGLFFSIRVNFYLSIYLLFSYLFCAALFWYSWWHHDMETLSALLALCEGNPQSTSDQFQPKVKMNSWQRNSLLKPILELGKYFFPSTIKYPAIMWDRRK